VADAKREQRSREIAVKPKKSMPRIETLEGRNMLSASPLGEIAAPAPEPSVAMLSSGRVRVSSSSGVASQDDGSTAAVKLENVFVSGVQGDPTPKIVLRWEKIAVPVVEEASSGGIVSEEQGYGLAVGGNARVGWDIRAIEKMHEAAETSYLTVKMKDVFVSGAQDDTLPADGRTKPRLVVLEAAPRDEGSADASNAVFIGMGGATKIAAEGDAAASLLPGGGTNFRHEHTRPES
jgi:hypothetical protein